MAGPIDRLRGFILAKAHERRSEDLFHTNGSPNCQAIAARMGLRGTSGKQHVWNVMVGRHPMRKGAKRRRVTEPRPSQTVIDGLCYWLHMSELDVREALEDAEPVPPFDSTQR